MKRIGNLYQGICSMENLELADYIAQKGKKKQKGVKRHNLRQSANLLALQQLLTSGTFKTSPYKIFTIFEPKERQIYQLPYYPDRIVHHAIMNVLEPYFVASFTADTYSSLKGRGVHAATRKLYQAVSKDQGNTTYCLKLDIRKFYPSIDHEILKKLLRRKFKDTRLLELLDEIIDSAPGVPIGNYLSQYLANFYLSGFDHWIKETKAVRYYYRYADDIVILGANKPDLHRLLADIRDYLENRLNLAVKGNYQIFPVAIRGIDFGGYVIYPDHIRLRKTIKQAFARAVASGKPPQVIASYLGWAKHANSINLTRKLLNVKSFNDFNVKPKLNTFQGEKVNVYEILNQNLIIWDFKIVKSKFADGSGKRLDLQIEIDGVKRVIFCGSIVLMDLLERIGHENLPFEARIIRKDKHYELINPKK